MDEGEEKKGFTIRDRRVSSRPEEPATEAETKKEEPRGKPQEGQEEAQGEPQIKEPSSGELPEINFSAFIFSLSTSALLHLGEVPDPGSGKREKDLPLAKQTIDILGMLREKTRGNLTNEEEKMLDHILADLRWRYVREIRG